MCGIVGYVGNGKAASNLFDGLKSLEYRGYDSAGIALGNKKIKIYKTVGEVNNLKNKIEFNKKSSYGIAHTRWATHGKADLINCHPHTSGEFVLVHNGIIENYIQLKNEFNFKTYSKTDSEIIAKIIESFYKNEEKLLRNSKKIKKNVILSKKMIEKLILNSISKAQKLLKGSWAVALIFQKLPNVIFVFKNLSPVLIGSLKTKKIVASDVFAISKLCRKKQISYFSLVDNEIAIVRKKQIEFYDKNLNPVYKESDILLNKHEKKSCKNFSHFMQKEIFEISNAVCETLKEDVSTFKSAIEKASCLTFIGCGTAYHACLAGKIILQEVLNKKINVELASEYRYSKQIFENGELVIAITQSGETADTIAGLRLAKENNLKTAVITNTEKSTILNFADYMLITQAGKEKAVAATKTFSTQLASIIKLSGVKLNEKKIYLNLEKTIKTYSNEAIFKNLFCFKKFFFIGKGIDGVIALESALKLKEITYSHAEGYYAGELKHGTLSLLDENSLVVAIITKRCLIDKTVNSVCECKARGAKTLIISQFDLEKNCDFFFKLEEMQENLMPLFSIIPIQFFAYFSALEKKYNPDMPRNLAKSVTVE